MCSESMVRWRDCKPSCQLLPLRYRAFLPGTAAKHRERPPSPPYHPKPLIQSTNGQNISWSMVCERRIHGWVLHLATTRALPLPVLATKGTQTSPVNLRATLKQIQPPSKNLPTLGRHSSYQVNPPEPARSKTQSVVKTPTTTATARLPTLHQSAGQNAHKLASEHPKTL